MPTETCPVWGNGPNPSDSFSLVAVFAVEELCNIGKRPVQAVLI